MGNLVWPWARLTGLLTTAQLYNTPHYPFFLLALQCILSLPVCAEANRETENKGIKCDGKWSQLLTLLPPNPKGRMGENHLIVQSIYIFLTSQVFCDLGLGIQTWYGWDHYQIPNPTGEEPRIVWVCTWVSVYERERDNTRLGRIRSTPWPVTTRPV